MTDKVKENERPEDGKPDTIEVVRLPHEPLPIDKAVYLTKVRKAPPSIARKHCQLDAIDIALKIISDAKNVVDIVETEHGDLVEVRALTETEESLLSICATLAQILREEWTYA